MTNKLETLRIAKNYTQEEMSRLLDISFSQYRNIEKNRSTPSVEIAMKLADVLKCKIEDIFQP
jgi:putative transcriptional regulator